MPSHNPQYQEIVSVNLPLRASLNKDNQTFLMKVDSKQGKRVPNPFDADLSYAHNSSHNEDSTIRKAQSTVRS